MSYANYLCLRDTAMEVCLFQVCVGLKEICAQSNFEGIETFISKSKIAYI